MPTKLTTKDVLTKLTPKDAVAMMRNPKHSLHKYFDWNDRTAVKRWVARQLKSMREQEKTCAQKTRVRTPGTSALAHAAARAAGLNPRETRALVRAEAKARRMLGDPVTWCGTCARQARLVRRGEV